ncbi:MAG: hypothetical protein ACO1RX_05975 [Candidatus Sericytochromatia bacterium]
MPESALTLELGQLAQPANPALAKALQVFAEPDDPREPIEILRSWLTGHHPEVLSERLKALDDGLPAPALVAWHPLLSTEQEESRYSSADRRTLRVFKELLAQERKSSGYFHEFRALCERLPQDEGLARLLLSYLRRWEGPEAAKQYARDQLARHPDWLLLRSAWASQGLFHAHPLQPDPEAVASYESIWNGMPLLEAHLAGHTQPLPAETVLAFHGGAAAYFLLTERLPRAAWAINLCATLDPHSPELTFLVMLFTVVLAHHPEQAAALKTFLSRD